MHCVEHLLSVSFLRRSIDSTFLLFSTAVCTFSFIAITEAHCESFCLRNVDRRLIELDVSGVIQGGRFCLCWVLHGMNFGRKLWIHSYHSLTIFCIIWPAVTWEVVDWKRIVYTVEVSFAIAIETVFTNCGAFLEFLYAYYWVNRFVIRFWCSKYVEW